MFHCRKFKYFTVLVFAIPALAYAAGSPALSQLTSCYEQLRPFTHSGRHATIYPHTSGIIFLPGTYKRNTGVWIYTAQGISFVSISDAFRHKPVAFSISPKESVVYQPPKDDQRAQVWIRGASRAPQTGIQILFKGANDRQKRTPLVHEVHRMVNDMAKTWDQREYELVQAVRQGRYLWAEVDVDHYRDAIKNCQKLLSAAPQAGEIRSSLQAQMQAMNHRAAQSGVIHDQTVHPSAFLSTPQY